MGRFPSSNQPEAQGRQHEQTGHCRHPIRWTFWASGHRNLRSGCVLRARLGRASCRRNRTTDIRQRLRFCCPMLRELPQRRRSGRQPHRPAAPLRRIGCTRRTRKTPKTSSASLGPLRSKGTTCAVRPFRFPSSPSCGAGVTGLADIPFRILHVDVPIDHRRRSAAFPLG